MSWSGPSWCLYRKWADLTEPGPTLTIVFLDEREDSINDGMFVVDMTGYPNTPSVSRLVDMPASYHVGRGAVVC